MHVRRPLSLILAEAIGRELHSKQVLEFPLSHLEHVVVTTIIGILSRSRSHSEHFVVTTFIGILSRSRLLLPLDDVLLVCVRG